MRLTARIFCLVLFASTASSLDMMSIDTQTDTSYLPYRLEDLRESDWGTRTKRQLRPAQVLRTFQGDSTEGTIIIGRNAGRNTNLPATFGICSYPDWILQRDINIAGTVSDWTLYEDALTGMPTIACFGYLNDTVWVFRVHPESGKRESAYLFSHSYRESGIGWEPVIRIVLSEDYDYDGLHELFVYVSSGIEAPRILFCVEIETLQIEWSISVSSLLQEDRFHSCRDSLNPSVIFSAYGCGNEVSDSSFADTLSYLAIVDQNGTIVHNQIIAESNRSSIDLTQGKDPLQFYLAHETVDKVRGESSGFHATYGISQVNLSGESVATVEVDHPIQTLWLGEYDDSTVVFVLFKNRQIEVYDTSLNLVAESNSVGDQFWYPMGKMRIADHSEECFVFSDGIYNSSLQKLLAFPFPADFVQPASVDSKGNIKAIVISTDNRYTVAAIAKRSFPELLSIFYVRNRLYVLLAVTVLAVGIIFSNYYRRRAKTNLRLISEQKRQLEQAHQALREAQAAIVAHEKYRQAKDIAGGFAHEIRNALFPARSALDKLITAESGTLRDPESIRELSRFTDEAVERAIKMTRLISDYTKLDSIRMPESVDLRAILEDVIKANIHRIERQGIRIDIPNERAPLVEGNSEQFRIVFNNLLLNSLDALAEIADPAITIRWSLSDCFLLLAFSDNGSGMTPEEADLAFDVFYSTKPASGTGLGLAISKKIIEMYDAAITAASKIEQGTTIDMRFRVSDDSRP